MTVEKQDPETEYKITDEEVQEMLKVLNFGSNAVVGRGKHARARKRL